MRTIGIVTSGGDAPGMNAAIRAVVRTAQSLDFRVIGFQRGWEGLLSNTFRPLNARSVSGIIQTGGTILHTSRCREIRTEAGLRKAGDMLTQKKIDGLVVVGGDGSFKAAQEISRFTDAAIAGIPATIDNDVFATDETIGFDSAMNTAVEEIDKIRDTATSLDRVFIVEVMGRTRGFLAAHIGLTVGAEIILVPEVKTSSDDVCNSIKRYVASGKKSAIIVAAEGIGDTHALAGEIEKQTGIETRLSILGYAQRGGNPTARSRLLASLYGEQATRLIAEGKRNVVVGLRSGEITSMEMEITCANRKELDLRLLKLADVLAR